VAGEAGAGKLALVRRFAQQLAGRTVLFGACDPLDTPRPMGPLLDLATELARLTGRPAGDAAATGDLLAFAARARRRLRELGVARIPRGRRASTTANRAGLTRREHDVLLLVAAGMSNREIAGRLFLSPKTVERHLTGILRKLDARSRLDAVSAASALGILRPRPD
jgi:DNA-binding CsgD family transcriptional regulator